MIILKRLRVDNFKLLRRVELAFPRQGSVLIEGLNESGKSTLFESVFYAIYGIPLATEGKGKGNLESVIRYGEESASVELVLEVDETELEIRRTLKRGGPSQAALEVRGPGAPTERIAGVLAVNARVVEELGGLDAEALLNSCFVEQKKLSKLEDLATGQRRDSLRKLLNLDKLTGLGERFKATLQDERALAQARERLELAEVMARLPALISERSELESHLSGAARSGRGSSSDGVVVEAKSVERVWTPTATMLKTVRASSAGLRRTGNFLASSGLLLLLAAAGLALGGVADAIWILPLAMVVAMLALPAFRSTRQREGVAAELEAELSAVRDSLLAKIGELEGRRRRVGEKLRTEECPAELGECRFQVEELSRRLLVKTRAAAIVEGTMERIVRLVLPNTERNLGQILPLLTAGRYHEVRIGEDYQLRVWDDSAGRYVSKSLFSGGAKDQFSLGLRLAFALATLPQELGAAPGFIFLDEPLSAFDGPRTEALVRLLTTGQVAESFRQIFVISHNRSFDVGAFQYRLVMRDGRVVENTLPSQPW